MFIKILILIYFSLNIFANTTYVDFITLAKIKKLVKKEEQIALAYKEYIRKNAKVPEDTITPLNHLKVLIDDTSFLNGFNSKNPFDKNKYIKLDYSQNVIEVVIPENLKSNAYDYYYSNEYREYTRAPLSELRDKIKILLNSKEKLILKKIGNIITSEPISTSPATYYLDNKGILHWYEKDGKYIYSITNTNDLIISDNISIFDNTGSLSDEFKEIDKKEEIFKGQKIYNNKNEYINLGDGKVIKIGGSERKTGKTILQFTRRAGGMIVNGDIYTWGNNNHKVVGIGQNKYTNSSGNNGRGKPVTTSLVRAKSKTYNSKIDSRTYFSSPLRPKFTDFTSDVWHKTCGVTANNELYCSGNMKGFDYQGSDSYGEEYLYRSKYFNGKDNYAIKLFPLTSTWIVLGNNLNEDSGYLYYWGSNSQGWAGSGNRNVSSQTAKRSLPSTHSLYNTRFKELTFTLSLKDGGHRRIGALSANGDIYTWGVDGAITNGYNCNQNIAGQSGKKNLCEPMKVKTNEPIKFKTLQGGQQTFIATDINDDFYRIKQPKINGKASLAVANKIASLISKKVNDKYVYEKYKEEDDTELLSVDISSTLPISKSTYGQGIVWVNSKNELKGDYFTSDNKNDEMFKESIKRIKWKKIRVIEDGNGMCGIDIYNQMYCWGLMSFYSGGVPGNTFMLPLFNTNLHDLDKDFLVTEGLSSNRLTNMTSGDWTTGNSSDDLKKPYFIKYPTYIGGFNYEFTFK